MKLSSGEGKRGRHQLETFTVAIHEAEEGGYWGDVLELPGCASQGETLDELKENIFDAIQAWLEVQVEDEGARAREAVSTMTVRVAVPD